MLSLKEVTVTERDFQFAKGLLSIFPMSETQLKRRLDIKSKAIKILINLLESSGSIKKIKKLYTKIDYYKTV